MTRYFLILCIWFARPMIVLSQERDPLPLEDRVKEAKLIVVGKLRGYVTISKHQDSSWVDVEEVLSGIGPTNKTLLVWYSTDRQFIPGIASSTHHVTPTNRYICFLTCDQNTQSSSNTFQARAVGKWRYAHDAFELATEKALKEVRDCIEERNKKK
jgi:hypothetical protein